jgi:hypothetical protein
MIDPSSSQRRCYIRTITASIQLKNKIIGRESQGAFRQDKMIGGKPPVVFYSDANQNHNGASPRQSRKKGSAIAINCDYD